MDPQCTPDSTTSETVSYELGPRIEEKESESFSIVLLHFSEEVRKDVVVEIAKSRPWMVLAVLCCVEGTG